MMKPPFVLVCDDNRNIANSLVFILQAAGYRAQATYNTLECVGVARREPPSLILMDIMMPGVDGAIASASIKDIPELEDVPVVLISAMTEDEVQEKAQQAGAVDYVLKPFRKHQLIEKVRRWAHSTVEREIA